MHNLIWDLDGTLIDSEKEIIETLMHAMMDVNVDSSKAVKPFRIGPPIDTVLKDSFDSMYLTKEKLNAVIAAFRKRYDACNFAYTCPFDGIDNIIQDTVHYTHYIITNKPDVPSKKIIDKFGWGNKITLILTPYTFGNEKKTKAQLFEYLISSRNLQSENTYAIGDMYTDYLAAQSAGIKTIGVLWGTGKRDELSKCACLCDSVFELEEFLKLL